MKPAPRACLVLLVLLSITACGPPSPPAGQQTDALQLQAVLGGEADARYLRAEGRRSFRFPQDHGLHEGFRNEWWYFTGNLEATDGRRFGFQLTFFTHALPPDTGLAAAASAWHAQRLWMAHFAVVDAAGGTHRAFERFSREALGLAGARLEPDFRVWLDDWQVWGQDESAAQPQAGSPWQLQAAQDGTSLVLDLMTRKGPVLHGEQGLSRKSSAAGNASWYYSLTRLQASGQLQLDGESFAVSGAAWLDREWSTSALDADQSGWDWFSLQFGDGTELMYYQLRDAQGGAHAFSSGSVVAADGTSETLERDAVQLEELSHWVAPSGVRYATRWRMQADGRDLVVEAVLQDQWMDLSLPYWEGAVTAFDANSGARVGQGYLEMVR